MELIEHWKRWKPLAELNGQYYIKSIEYTVNKFTIIFGDPGNPKIAVKVLFECVPDIYKKTIRKYRTQTINYLQKNYGEAFYTNWSFFKVENSSYVRWISTESGGVYHDWPFIHYCFITNDSILDVVYTWEPVVTLIDLPEQTI